LITLNVHFQRGKSILRGTCAPKAVTSRWQVVSLHFIATEWFFQLTK